MRATFRQPHFDSRLPPVPSDCANSEPPSPDTRLTSLSPAGGCGCKLDAERLGELLRSIAPAAGENEGAWLYDDAAIFDHDGSKSLVYTIDFFTPLVDDPADWGRIAAAHALSDVYAMGGKPLLALSVAAWPREGHSMDGLGSALRAAREKLTEAGARLVGGHTIWDSSPKLGFTILGEVATDSVLRKGGGRPGDILILTKPVGSGVVSSALKHSAVAGETLRRAVGVMTALNDGASTAAVSNGVVCATDVTGFGLGGHLHDMAQASGLAAVIRAGSIPIIDGALELLPMFATSNADANRRYAGVELSADLDPHAPMVEMIFDPQSSGGLLLACPPARLERLRTHLNAIGAESAPIGWLVDGRAGHVSIEP